MTPTPSPPTWWIRTLLRVAFPATLVGIVYATLWIASLFDEPPGLTPGFFIGVVAAVCGLDFLLRRLACALQEKLPWQGHALRRLVLQVLLASLLSVAYFAALYVPLKLLEIQQGAQDTLAWPHLAMTSLLALVLGLALTTLQVGLDFFARWQDTQREAERREAQRLRAELDALTAQLNPHFLFNSLTTVHALIAQDTTAARSLVLELGDVLRYALCHGRRDLVPLAQELDFLDAFRALLQARHGEGLRIEVAAMTAQRALQLPPLSLQLLVENAVRHNRLLANDPLVVSLRAEHDRLIVRNPIKPRQGDSAGTGNGLHNIAERYRLLGAEAPRVRAEDGVFEVSLALLPCAP